MAESFSKMRFDLTRPCKDCPFRSDTRPFGLAPERVREILGDARKGTRQWWPAPSFPCHRTIEYLDDNGVRYSPNSQQCAGVMIILHREGRPNDAMQIAERMGLWNPANLDPDAPVYASTEEAIKGQGS
jgi:hypothetical protein